MATEYVFAVLIGALLFYGGFLLGRKTRTYGTYIRRQGDLRFQYGKYDIWSFDNGRNWLTPILGERKEVLGFVPAPPVLLKQLGALHEIFVRMEEAPKKDSEEAIRLKGRLARLDLGKDWRKQF